jgi:hypothetical protein
MPRVTVTLPESAMIAAAAVMIALKREQYINILESEAGTGFLPSAVDINALRLSTIETRAIVLPRLAKADVPYRM